MKKFILILCLFVTSNQLLIGQTTDHTTWTDFLQEHVSNEGHVNYNAIKANEAGLNDYLNLLIQNTPNDSWSKTCYLNDGNGALVQFDPTSPIVEDACFTPCVNWVDYDNDGDMDLYVHNVGCEGSLSALYENLGDMQFTKHDFIDEIYRYSWANSAVWGDLDNDADLDLFISVEKQSISISRAMGRTTISNPV